jgi:hypothetical protein
MIRVSQLFKKFIGFSKTGFVRVPLSLQPDIEPYPELVESSLEPRTLGPILIL